MRNTNFMEEDGRESSGKLQSFISSNILIIGLLGVGTVLIIVGLIQMMGSQESEIKFEEGTNIEPISEIKVDVDGAVVRPGLYSLKSDSRLADALIAAGGLSANADRKAINLAVKLSDGQKIYISEIGESAPVLGSNASNSGSTGIISINSSGQTELETLPGIGPARAGDIMSGRPYSSVEDLRTRNILGEKTYEAIKDLVSL